MDWDLDHRTPKLIENLNEIISCCCYLIWRKAKPRKRELRLRLSPSINFIMSMQYEGTYLWNETHSGMNVIPVSCKWRLGYLV